MDNKELIEDLLLKKDALTFLSGKIAEIPARNEEEGISKQELIEAIAYWIGAIQCYLEDSWPEDTPPVPLDTIIASSEAMLSMFELGHD